MSDPATAPRGAPPPVSREIREGLSPGALAAGPPPVPQLRAPFAARLAVPQGADLDLVHAWMGLPHVARFFDQAWTRQRWHEELAAQRAGTFARPVLVAHEGTPVAYVELYRAARDLVSRHYDARSHDVGLHIAIGVPEATGRGLGPRILDAVARGVFAVDARCRRIVMEPDAANRAARHAAQRAGLAPIGEVDLPHKRAALFVRHRDSEHTCDRPSSPST